MTQISSDLPSQVEESFSACPRFRIVLIGNSGVGKSSLIKSVFRIDFKELDIAHNRAGSADINREFTSTENARFILHDSEGFEAGSEKNWNTAKDFLRSRSGMEHKDQVHAIWLCKTSPFEGDRLLQTGEEMLFSLADELQIPVIVVCTKYDRLIREQEQENHKKNLTAKHLRDKAKTRFRDRTAALEPRKVVAVSIHEGYLDTLKELVTVTLDSLGVAPGDVPESAKPGTSDDGVPLTLAAAQQVIAYPKVISSIQEGFKKYWRNLARSAFFEGQVLQDCVWRIHDDILKVWNFNDLRNVLRGEKFYVEMTLLVQPMLPKSSSEIQEDPWFSKFANSGAAAAAIAGPFAHPLIAAGVSFIALKFLYGKYKKMALSGRYLGFYITNLICVLQRLLDKIQDIDPALALTEDVVMGVVNDYKETHSFMIRQTIEAMSVGPSFEKDIASLIIQHTCPAHGTDENDEETDEKRKKRCTVM